MIQVTENAVKHLKEILALREDAGEVGLRLAVERGGCAGMSYSMRIGPPEEGDVVVDRGGVRFVVAAESREFVAGAEIDYEESLTDAGFKIRNPNAARSCGCGTSFEPAEAGKTPEYEASMDGSVCGSEDKA